MFLFSWFKKTKQLQISPYTGFCCFRLQEQKKPTEAKRTGKAAMLSDKQPSPNKRKGFEYNPKA